MKLRGDLVDLLVQMEMHAARGPWTIVQHDPQSQTWTTYGPYEAEEAMEKFGQFRANLAETVDEDDPGDRMDDVELFLARHDVAE